MNRWRKFTRSEGGFLPMLLALVLAAGAVIGIGAYILKGSTLALRSSKADYEQLVALEKTIRAHVFRTGVLPCPALPNGAGNSKSSCAGNENDGVAPWAELGLTRADAIDPYGRLISYHVDPVSAANICQGAAAKAGTLVLNPTSNTALFVLISHGPNGLGGWLPKGTQLPNPASGQEQENCADITDNVSVTCRNANPTNVTQGPHQGDASLPAYFDDMLLAAVSADYNPFCLSGGVGKDKDNDGIPDHCQDGRGNDDDTPACSRFNGGGDQDG